jgi:hypothetical protein
MPETASSENSVSVTYAGDTNHKITAKNNVELYPNKSSLLCHRANAAPASFTAIIFTFETPNTSEIMRYFSTHVYDLKV